MRIPLVYGSSAPLDNILYHKNVPMIIQSLGSNGCLSLIYSLIVHSITFAYLYFRLARSAGGGVAPRRNNRITESAKKWRVDEIN